MSLILIAIFCLLVLVWVLSIVDIFRQHYSGWTTVGWIALVVILPFVGTAIYWFAHDTSSVDVEHQAQVEAERRREGAARRF